jgi:hypothetical protein
VGHQAKILLALLALVITTVCSAQEVVTVKGIVADSATLKPMGFVNVVVKRNYRGTTTDQNGYFTINAGPNDTIKFSFVGYKTLEFPAKNWEPSVIMMPEEIRLLKTIHIRGESMGDRYEHLFDQENIKLKNSQKKIPFYVQKEKKEKILVARAKQESIRVKTYVDLLVKNETVKNDLMKKHRLTESQYYDLLAKFNEKNVNIMYYLTDSELLTLLYRFYDINAD